MANAAVEVHGLSKRYRRGAIGARTLREEMAALSARLRGRPRPESPEEFHALRDVSFSVSAGRVCGVIGRNGSGKTTLLKLLSAITLPDAGEAVLRGRTGSLLEVGAGFHPELDGVENIYLNGAILGMSRREIAGKLDDIIRFADIGPVLSTPVKRYSSGMFVRLAFAIAAHLEPEILMIDEVLAVGDAEFQRKCLGKMKSVAGEGRTVLFVSHNLAAVRQLCDMAIHLSAGELKANGPTAAVVDGYLAGLATDRRASGSAETAALGAELVIRDATTGTPRSELLFAGDYEFVLRLRARERLARTTAAIAIHGEDGALLALLSSVQEGLAPFDLDGAGEVVFAVPSLALVPGTYAVGFAVYVWGEDHPRLEAERVLSFDVLPAMVNGASDAYSAQYGVVRVASEASYRPLGGGAP